MAHDRDHERAHAIAVDAGLLLLRLREEQAPDFDDVDATKAFAKLADRASDDYILARLREEFPDDAILSEETEDDFLRLEANRVWIVDPVDGTWEYSHNRSDFAVHVALWERTKGLTAGTVAVPAMGEIWSTHTQRTEADHVALPTDRDVRIVVSRTRPLHDQEQFRLDLAHALAPLGVPGVTILQVGSVGACCTRSRCGAGVLLPHRTHPRNALRTSRPVVERRYRHVRESQYAVTRGRR